MTNHTPGPWYPQPTPDSNRPRIIRAFNERWHIIESDDPAQPQIAHVRIYGAQCDGAEWTAAEANARLIAAAPELLAALYNMLEDGDETDRQQAMAAIAKAEGRS